ncbi:MAG: transcriptional repressor [Clostridiales bacterium]|nr:transcriptional repressor [Clostridiales bacterium]
MIKRRHSRQRDLIYDYVSATKLHPTAEMIYQDLKEVSPGLSRGTVYRNLNQMVEEGRISRLPFQVERYDGNTHPHPHLVCESCGQVSDLCLDYDDGLDRRISQELGCQIRWHESYFYGRCAACAATAAAEG